MLKNGFPLQAFFCRNFFLSLIILFFLSGRISAQSYDFISYGVEDGLSQSEPRCMLQDSRGLLWLGTAGGGVCSFDGIKFNEYGKKEGLPGEIITCIAEDSSGNVWFGTTDGGAAMYDGKTFSVIDNRRGLNGNEVRSIIAEKNKILIGVDFGIFEYNPETNQVRKIAAVNNLNSMCLDENGELWIGSSEGLAHVTGGEKKTVSLNLPDGEDHTVLCVEAGQQGQIFVGLNNGMLIYKKSSGTFFTDELTEKLAGKQVRNFYTDRDGSLWVATFNNLVVKYSLDQKMVVYDRTNGLSAETIYSITEDNTRHIWMGTREQSLVKLRSEAFSYFADFPGLNSSTVFRILEDHSHRMWIGSAQEGIHVYDGVKSTPVLNNGKSFKQPLTMAEDQQQRIWIGHADGVTCLVNDHPVQNLLPGIRVRSLLADRQGNLWVGTWGQGVFRFDIKGKSAVKIEGDNYNIIPGSYVHAILEAHDSTIYFGTGAGLVHYFPSAEKENAITFYGQKEGLCNAYVGSVVEDPFGKIWFHTDVCIMRFDPKAPEGKKLKSYSDQNGLASNTFYLMAFDSTGQLWVGSNKGIDRIVVDQDGNFISVRNYSRNEGFRGIECNSRAVCVSSDKCIWFGTVKGVIRYNPAKDIPDNAIPEVNISGISLFLEKTDWTYYDAHETGWFHLPDKLILDFEHNHLTFLYRAIHLQSPQLTQYQFMLVGFDSTWQHENDATQFSYTNLSPGNYFFKVRARNGNGKWSEPAVSCMITILPPPPPFWKKWWFIVLAILLGGGIFYYSIVGRTRRILKQKMELEKEVKERTLEISRQNEEKTLMLKEIHHRVKNNLQVISSLLNLQADGISDKKVLSLFEDCRHRVNSMALIHEKMYQSKNLVNIDIRNYIDELIRSLIDAYDTNKTIHLHTDIEEHPFRIDTIVPLGLILNEIISNSLKYAFNDMQEGDLYVSLKKTGANQYLLEVSDNGKGIPSTINFEKAESLGMQLILMLSEQINGEVTMKREKGTKYKIEFEEEEKDRF
jgi:two-component sensor histidine kinase/ligand-binding sensor domain-containing protein